MAFKATPIPDWYTDDWSPALSRGELPAMTWEAVEEVIDDLLTQGPARQAAQAAFRTLWLESARMMPMDLLQALLTTSAEALDPNRLRARTISTSSMIPSRANGALPRWSFTDIEVALTHTWTGLALALANRRHHDLLMRRGESLSPTEVVTLIFLLVAGLPGPTRQIAKETPVSEPYAARAVA